MPEPRLSPLAACLIAMLFTLAAEATMACIDFGPYSLPESMLYELGNVSNLVDFDEGALAVGP